eukprot:3653455-Amphidinium_carterae.1
MGDHLPAVELGAGRTCVDVVAGRYHLCALLDNSAVKCWGDGWNGKFGYEDTIDRGSTSGQMGNALPSVDLGDDCTPVQVSASEGHSCVLCDSGSVKCWGGSQESCQETAHGSSPGTMGNNLPTLSFGTGKIVVAVSASDGHTCVLLSDETVRCCGDNSYGELGYGDTTDRYLTAQMGDHLPAVTLGALTPLSVFAAFNHKTTFIFTDGSVKSIGHNLNYELGYNDAVNRNLVGDTLPAISLGSGLTAVSGGFGHGR